MSDNFGKLGDLNKYRGPTKPTALPQWLLDQMTANTTVDEGGGQKTEYSFNENPFGGFQRDGKYYTQVGQNKLKNPAAVMTDPDLGDYTEVGNVNDLTPQGPNYAMLAAVLGAGLGGAALGLGGEAGGLGAAGVGAGGLGIDTSLLAPVTLEGLPEIGAMTGYTGGAGAGGLGALGAGGGGGGGAAAGAGTYGIDTSMLAPVTTGAAPSIGTMAAAPGSPSLLQQAGNYITSNPGNAVRGALGLASLGSSVAGSKNASGSTGSTDAGSIIDQMANANRVNQNTPIGSRAWSQGADGRWTVNDTLNPAEQANFENVQGLNAGVTGYTRDMLARLLSAPPRGRADAPFTVNGRTIGG